MSAPVPPKSYGYTGTPVKASPSAPAQYAPSTPAPIAAPKPTSTYGDAQAAVPDIQALYNNLLAEVSRQAAPASTAPYANQVRQMYGMTSAAMQGYDADRLRQQELLRQGAGMDFSALERQLANLEQPQPSRTVLLYGMQG